MKKNLIALGVLSLATACGGGGGGTGVTPPSVYPTVAPTASPQPATVTGKVVDYDTGTTLAGVQVALASWAPNASPSPIGTTAPDGTFSFSTSPGTYEIQIGDNSAQSTRMTLVQKITINSGANALLVATPPPQPYVTPDPVQLTGFFRLKSMNAAEQNALSEANADLSASFTNDEFVWETAHWSLEQQVTAPPQASYPPSYLFGANSTGAAAMVSALMNAPASVAGGSSGAGGPGVTSCDASIVAATVSDLTSSIAKPWLIGVECDLTRGGEVTLGVSDLR